MSPRKVVAIAGVLLAVYVLLVVGAYVWQFHEERLATDSGAWGQFGDYLAGMTNPVIALLNVAVIVYLALAVQRLNEAQRQDRETEERRVQASVDLHREWNSQAIYGARTKAGKLVRLFPEDSYFEIEDKVPYEDASDIWVVVGFFQRLELLVRHEKVDRQLICELFGELFFWWWVVSFWNQLERCDCDARAQMIRLREWFDIATTATQRHPWLERANRDLANARQSAGLPPTVVT